MQKVLATIINYDQTAYVRGRYIGESIRLISDLLGFTEENSIGGILFSADFEKAFVSIEHPFLLAVLKSFGFCPPIYSLGENNIQKCRKLCDKQLSLHRILPFRKGYQTRRSIVCTLVHPMCRNNIHSNTRK